MLVALGVYGGLFAFSFLTATLAPGSSEAALSALLLVGGWNPVILIAAASLGNIAGSVFNWYCGRFLSHYKDRPWFPLKEHHYKKKPRAGSSATGKSPCCLPGCRLLGTRLP